MKAHLALKCTMVTFDIKREYLNIIKNNNDTQQSIQNQYSRNDNNNQLDELRVEKINKALIRLFICCGIPFSVVDSPFFIDFAKSLCYEYKAPKRTTLSTRYLNAEIADITLKIEEELRHLTNLTLG